MTAGDLEKWLKTEQSHHHVSGRRSYAKQHLAQRPRGDVSDTDPTRT
jgi:hypothetical protein